MFTNNGRSNRRGIIKTIVCRMIEKNGARKIETARKNDHDAISSELDTPNRKKSKNQNRITKFINSIFKHTQRRNKK